MCEVMNASSDSDACEFDNHFFELEN